MNTILTSPSTLIENSDFMSGIAITLSTLVKFRTVSSFNHSQESDEEFAALRASLASLFPGVHKVALREDIGDRGILFTWKGRDPALEPAIFCAHFDVVPAEDSEKWDHDPFSGDISGGYVWGRGTQDIKIMMACLLQAANELAESGFTPQRTILFAFGGDEEVGGMRGAGAIAGIMTQRSIKAAFLHDEGGPIAVGMISFASRPLALIGVAEKGYMDVLLTATGEGGHASMPPKQTATGRICKAVAELEKHPFPPRLVFTVRNFLDMLSPYVPRIYGMVFRSLWLTSPAVISVFSASPTTNALVRTTMASTMLSGSTKENVLADKATAIINTRILPGDSSGEVLRYIQDRVSKYGVTASNAHLEHCVEPSQESPTDTVGWQVLSKALAVSHPEAAPVPFLFSAGTDTKHYSSIARAMYRFTPLSQTQSDLKGVHGRNERVALSELDKCLAFYRSVLKEL